MRSFSSVCKASAVALVVSLASTAAHATISFSNENGGGNPDSNVLFNDGVQTGTSIQGHFNDAPGVTVTYTSPTTLTASGGQANIDYSSGPTWTNLNWSLTSGFGYTEEKFTLVVAADGFVMFSGKDQFGNTYNSGLFAVSANGNNQFRFFTADNQLITLASLQTTVAITSFQQDRMGGIASITAPPAVPLPPAVALFGSGMAGLILLGRRRRARKQKQAVG
jgi:hypothetical protein